MSGFWNANTHYHPLILASLPPDAMRVLDVGGGDGIAANAWWDLPLAALGMTLRQVLGLVHGQWDHSAPTRWPPPLTYGEMKALSARMLPGVRYQRHWLGRYSLVWRKPL